MRLLCQLNMSSYSFESLEGEDVIGIVTMFCSSLRQIKSTYKKISEETVSAEDRDKLVLERLAKGMISSDFSSFLAENGQSVPDGLLSRVSFGDIDIDDPDYRNRDADFDKAFYILSNYRMEYTYQSSRVDNRFYCSYKESAGSTSVTFSFDVPKTQGELDFTVLDKDYRVADVQISRRKYQDSHSYESHEDL